LLSVSSYQCQIFLFISPILILPSTNNSFLAFDSFFTSASIFNAKLLSPILFFMTNFKGDFPLKYFDPFLSWLLCSSNLLNTSVVMPVYSRPCLHLIKYKNQLFILLLLTARLAYHSFRFSRLLVRRLIMFKMHKNSSIISTVLFNTMILLFYVRTVQKTQDAFL